MSRFPDLTYEGPPLKPESILRELPVELTTLLFETNGFVAWRGGLHVRGVVSTPEWHSLEWAWHGGGALHTRFGHLLRTDLPFAEDCMGDQFILRQENVFRMSGESGELTPMGLTLQDFLTKALTNEDGLLQLEPLLKYEQSGKALRPGFLLMAYPPFISKEASKGVSLSAVPTIQHLAYLAKFAKSISSLPDGSKLGIVVEPGEK